MPPTTLHTSPEVTATRPGPPSLENFTRGQGHPTEGNFSPHIFDCNGPVMTTGNLPEVPPGPSLGCVQ